MVFIMKKGLFILLRGLPASGKTTIANNFVKVSPIAFTSLDPDTVDISSKEYRKFIPKMTKNPSPNVKMYSYLFQKSIALLSDEKNVIWQQPWTRLAEVKLTIQNMGYYFTTLGNNVWSTDLNIILEKLPFGFLVVQVNISTNGCVSRYQQRKGVKDFIRLDKTIRCFQKSNLGVPILNIDGADSPIKNAQLLIEFMENQTTQKNTQSPTIEKNA